VKCQIKARLRRQGIITRGEAVYKGEGRREALERVESVPVRTVIEHEFALLDHLVSSKAKRYGASSRPPGSSGHQAPQGGPGVGPVLAARFVAYVGDPNRFNKRTIASYSCWQS